MTFEDRYLDDLELALYQQLGAELTSISVSNTQATLVFDNPNRYSEYDFEDVGYEIAGGLAIRSIEAHDLGHSVTVGVFF